MECEHGFLSNVRAKRLCRMSRTLLAQPHGGWPIHLERSPKIRSASPTTWLLPNRPGALAQRRAIMVTRYGCVGLSA